MHTRKTFCRFCHANCAIEVDIDGDRAVAVRGDVSDPLFGGYTCMKGRELPAQANHPERLRSSQRRLPDGAFAAISSGDALDEIAGRLAAIRDRHGPRAIATYCGTYGFMNSAALPVALGFHHGLGSPSFYTSITIDQPAKVYLGSRVGAWLGGPQPFSRADVSMMIGNNPLTSHYAWQGSVPPFSPSRRLRDAKARGLKLICVDPRRTMVAQLADIHLQVRPGEDATLLAGMLRLILEEELHDREFCERWVEGWQQWRDFIFERGYTPEWAAPLTGIAAEEIRKLAAEIAGADGCVLFASRGINQHTNAVQTNRALMFIAAITGNWGRRGGAFLNLSIGAPISANAPAVRQHIPERPMVRRSPVGWIEAMRKGRPYPIKALIACNNPMSNWPGQSASREAFLALDLLVHIELFENETSAFADYVLPAATGIEKGDIGRSNDDRRVVWIDKMIEPPGEAKTDDWIWIELGKRFGYDDVLKERYKDPALFWDEMCIGNDQLRGITQQRLHSVPWRWVRFPSLQHGPWLLE